jgi:hypothetical protein
MLHTILPVPIILPSIRPPEDAPSILQVVVVFTIIGPPIRPRELTQAMHATIFPQAMVDTAIWPSKNTGTF